MNKIIIYFALLFAVGNANAAYIALDSARGVGNQNFNGSLGMHFDVLSPIKITQLGAFDSAQDGFSSQISVGIFDRDTGLLVSEVALFYGAEAPLIGQSRFIDITDIELGVGRYSIVAQGFNASNPNGNAGHDALAPNIDTGGGLITFVGGSYFNYTPNLDYPLIADGGPANRYDAGTFQFEAVSSVPVPAAIWLFGSGLIGLIVMRRK